MAAFLETTIKSDLQVRSPSKRVSIASALSVTTGSFWSLGLDRDGTGISNHMIVQNHTDSTIRLHQFYLHWGCAKVAPDANIPNQFEDDCLFHAAGGWSATGSSGIVTYHLDSETFLHILWDCPYNFNHYCNFVGLYLCPPKEKEPTAELFNIMYQDVADPGIIPKQRSPFDLVCCGPGDRSSCPVGWKTWGLRRACEVMKDNYYVSMTMGDSHKTSSTVSIFKTRPVDGATEPKLASKIEVAFEPEGF